MSANHLAHLALPNVHQYCTDKLDLKDLHKTNCEQCWIVTVFCANKLAQTYCSFWHYLTDYLIEVWTGLEKSWDCLPNQEVWLQGDIITVKWTPCHYNLWEDKPTLLKLVGKKYVFYSVEFNAIRVLKLTYMQLKLKIFLPASYSTPALSPGG